MSPHQPVQKKERGETRAADHLYKQKHRAGAPPAAEPHPPTPLSSDTLAHPPTHHPTWCPCRIVLLSTSGAV